MTAHCTKSMSHPAEIRGYLKVLLQDVADLRTVKDPAQLQPHIDRLETRLQTLITMLPTKQLKLVKVLPPTPAPPAPARPAASPCKKPVFGTPFGSKGTPSASTPAADKIFGSDLSADALFRAGVAAGKDTPSEFITAFNKLLGNPATGAASSSTAPGAPFGSKSAGASTNPFATPSVAPRVATASDSKGAAAHTDPLVATNITVNPIDGSNVEITHYRDSMVILGRVSSGDLLKISISWNEYSVAGVVRYTNLADGTTAMIRSTGKGYICNSQTDQDVVTLVRKFL